MGVPERRAREREALRQRILEAASQLVVEEGYESLSIRRIAERIEYAPSTIYLHFKDKAEILTSICSDVFEQLADRLEELHKNEPDPIKSLRKGMLLYIEFGLQHPSHYLVTFCTKTPAAVRGFTEQSVGMNAFDYLRRGIRRCMETGALPPGDVNLVSQSVLTSVHGVTSLLITMGDDPVFPWAPREQLIASTVEIILEGLRNSAGSTAPRGAGRE